MKIDKLITTQEAKDWFKANCYPYAVAGVPKCKDILPSEQIVELVGEKAYLQVEYFDEGDMIQVALGKNNTVKSFLTLSGFLKVITQHNNLIRVREIDGEEYEQPEILPISD